MRLSDLSFVNIFVGSNGAGKTTLLEAASIAANPTKPGWLLTLSQWRELPVVDAQTDDWLRSLFYGVAAGRPVEIGWVDENGTGTVGITPQLGNRFIPSGQPTSSSSGSGPQQDDFVGGVQLVYSPPGSQPVVTNLTLGANGIQVQGSGIPVKGGRGAFFIHARRSMSLGETASMLTSAAEQRTEGAIYEALRRVDPRLVRLVPGVRGREPIVLADIGLARLVPTNVLGDGFSRALLMVTGAVNRSHDLLLVDDIDSGLHNTVMEGVWRSLLDLNASRRFQVFCTTHSEEMLASTLAAFRDCPDLLRVFRLDRHSDDRVTVQPYTFDVFRDASLARMDIR